MVERKIQAKDIQGLLDRVEKVTKEKKLDLSSDEDLSIGIMNLISIEEHLFFTAQKTGKDDYYELLSEVRKMRGELLSMIIKEYEGEVWCISKHLLASSMRLMEVGTKQLGKGNKEEAKALFEKSYQLYSLFWALNLDMIDEKAAKSKADAKSMKVAGGLPKQSMAAGPMPAAGAATVTEKHGLLSRFGGAVKKAVNCCKEW